MTEEEKEEIITIAVNRAVEKAILMLPAVMDNLMKEKIAMQRLAKQFYTDNTDFNNHKDIVGSTVEQVETENPGKPYKEILDKAAPKIKKRIASINMSDMKSVSKPVDLKYSDNPNGEI